MTTARSMVIHATLASVRAEHIDALASRSGLAWGVLARHARAASLLCGLVPSDELVCHIVDAVRAELGAEEAGQVVVLDRSGNGLHLVRRERAPVCPRCLDIEPGTPGGTPEDPHPGPFTRDLCAPCEPRSGPGGA